MKKSIIYLSLISSFLLFSCKKTQENKAEESKVETTEQSSEAVAEGESGNKEVELTQAQYNASNIQLSILGKKNLSDVIRVNGSTELPAQSQADVSSFLSGTITSINVNLGDYVKKGQTIALIDSPEFIQLKEQYTISKSNLEYLELEYKRQQTLRQENVNSEKTYQKTKSDLTIERARFESLSNRLNLVNAAANAKSLRVVSPINGNISAIPIKIGSSVMAGQSLFSIVDNSELHLDLMVYEKDLPLVKVGQKVSFSFTNIDETVVTAKIFSITKSFEPGTKTVIVHAKIDNVLDTLIPGLYVNALIHIGEKTVDALPNKAIIKADGREFIFILEDEVEEAGGMSYHFERVEVKSGVSELGYTQVTILEPLPADSQIVIDGAYYVQSHLAKTSGGAPEHAH